MNDYWHKQLPAEPLYPDILWNKPEQKNLAGKLLIVGGNSHAISAPGYAYEFAVASGVGECKIIMPAATKKIFGKNVPLSIDFVASNPSGSLSNKALGDIINFAHWANAILFAGDMGRNSETAILLEQLSTLKGIQVYTRDAIDLFYANPTAIVGRAETLLVCSMAQLQKIGLKMGTPFAFTEGMGGANIAKNLHLLTSKYSSAVIIENNGVVYAAIGGQVVSTKLTQAAGWGLKVATEASILWLQNPSHSLGALATALLSA